MPIRFLLILVILAAGCATPPPERPLPTTAPAPARIQPWVLHLPGIAGICPIDHDLRAGLRKGGFDGPIEIYDWTCGDSGLPALKNVARNRAQAKIVSKKLEEQYRAHPGQPIFITCHSGGAGVAAWALEALPEDVKIDTWVMLAPALSPEFDLSKALRHVNRAISYSSLKDDLVLGTGTRIFGTIDGLRSESAGRVGFKAPAKYDPAQYAKLSQRPYKPEWAKLGHIGGHMGWMSTAFARAIIVPAMQNRESTQADWDDAGPVTEPVPDVLWAWPQ